MRIGSIDIGKRVRICRANDQRIRNRLHSRIRNLIERVSTSAQIEIHGVNVIAVIDSYFVT